VSWTTYPAKRGESLDAIAKRHNVAASHLKSANGELKLDKKSRLRVAMPIMVPMRSSGGAIAPVKVAQLTTASPAAPAAGAAAKSAALRLYTVRAGDTLYGIAQRHRTGVDILTALNNLTARSVLQPGLKLRLP
jgi:LysM repeat protein